MCAAQQPAAGAPTITDSLPAYEAIASMLAQLGVDEVFGLMGDDTIRLVSALVSRGLSYRNARHENAAIAMAAGYSSAAGRLGVCVISRGPGTTNGLTAAINASRGDAPVLIITGDESARPPGNTVKAPDGKQLDAAGVVKGGGLETFTPRSPASLRDTVGEAIAGALRGHAVLLTIPVDLFEAAAPLTEGAAPALRSDAPPPARARPEAILAATAVLADRRRPLILAGAGAWAAGARDVLVELADRLGAVLATTLRGKDMFRGHPYDVGIVGSFSHSAGRRAIEQADCVLVFGASLNRYTTNDGASLPDAPLIQVDSARDRIGRYHWADVAVVGDARVVAGQLLEALPARDAGDKPLRGDETRRLLADFDLADDFQPASNRWALDPRTLLIELDQLLPSGRAVVTDNGNFFGFVPPHIAVPDPDHFKLSSDFAVIGLGLGTALGAAIARPDVPTVLIVGDGGLLMSLGELETLARLAVPLTVIVMNDRAYGAELHFLELRGFAGSTAAFPDTDFAAIADAFGIESATVHSTEELHALGPALGRRDGPLLVDCKVVATVPAPFLSELLPERVTAH